VVATVILGTLLVSVLMARVQMDSQSRRAAARLQACQVLDDQLNLWWIHPLGLPRSGEGPVENYTDWTWRTRTRHDAAADALSAEVVIVEVFEPGSSRTAAQARVELLMPVMNNDAQSCP
jgi:hypothetical protein